MRDRIFEAIRCPFWDVFILSAGAHFRGDSLSFLGRFYIFCGTAFPRRFAVLFGTSLYFLRDRISEAIRCPVFILFAGRGSAFSRRFVVLFGTFLYFLRGLISEAIRCPFWDVFILFAGTHFQRDSLFFLGRFYTFCGIAFPRRFVVLFGTFLYFLRERTFEAIRYLFWNAFIIFAGTHFRGDSLPFLGRIYTFNLRDRISEAIRCPFWDVFILLRERIFEAIRCSFWDVFILFAGSHFRGDSLSFLGRFNPFLRFCVLCDPPTLAGF